MGNNVYIGKRYVPKIIGDWDNTLNTAYEGLSVVTWQGNSYTSKTDVPTGIDINNTTYWVKTGDYNAQVTIYRDEVIAYKNSADDAIANTNTSVTNLQNSLTTIPIDGSTNPLTVKKGLSSAIGTLASGEMYFTTDNKDFFIGDGVANNKLIQEKNLYPFGIDVTCSQFGGHSTFESGFGNFDSTQAFLDAIAFCTANKKTLFVPDGNFIITQPLVFSDNVAVHMSDNATLTFSLTNATDSAITVTDVDQVKYKFNVIKSSNGVGTGLKVKNADFNQFEIMNIQGFETNLHLLTDGVQMLDNDFNINMITGGTTAIKMETGSNHSMEGNKINFNFITECQYGFYFKEGALTSDIVYNDIHGTAIHCTKANGKCFCFDSPRTITDNYFEVCGFLTTNSGLIVGGTDTYQDDSNFAILTNNTFNLRLYRGDDKLLKMHGGLNVVTNTANKYSTHTLDTGYAPTSSSNTLASFNSGMPSLNNMMLVNVTIPASSAGTTRTFYVYNSFTGHGSPKPLKIIPVSGNFEKFSIMPTDNSHNVMFEVAIAIKNLVDTTENETLKFYAEIY